MADETMQSGYVKVVPYFRTRTLIDELYLRYPELAGPLKDELESLGHLEHRRGDIDGDWTLSTEPKTTRRPGR